MSERNQNEEMITAIQAMNKKWYNHRIFLVESLILGCLTFIGGFHDPFEANIGTWIQTVFFVLAAGFFVVLFSYAFNLLWIATLKPKRGEEESIASKKEKKEARIAFYNNWKNKLFYSIVQLLQGLVAILLIILVSLGIIINAYDRYVNIVIGFALLGNLLLFYDRIINIFTQSIPAEIEDRLMFTLKSIALYLLLIPLYPIFLLISTVDLFRYFTIEDKESQDFFAARTIMYIEIFL